MDSSRRRFLQTITGAGSAASCGYSVIRGSPLAREMLCGSDSVSRDGEPLRLTSNARSDYRITTRSDATDTELFAATELQRYLKKATGADLQIAETRHSHTISIDVGQVNAGCLTQARADAFRITADDERLALVGSTPQAALYAVYDFLERHVGIRWPAPGPDGEYVPTVESLTVDPVSEVRAPSFAFRVAGTFQSEAYVDWAVKNKLHVTRWSTAGEEAKQFATLRGGYLYDTNVHSFYDVVPPEQYGSSNAEYFGTTEGGTQSSQLDVTLPELVDVYATRANAFFEENPSATIFPVTPNDGYGWPAGASPARSILAHRRYGHPSKVKHHQLVSDAYFAFVNAVARRVRRHYPDKYIYSLAYANYVYPPATFRELESNVIVSVAHYSPADYAHTLTSERSAENSEFYNILREWRTVADNRWVYEYTVKYALDHLPYPIAYRLGTDIKTLHDLGYAGFYSQGGEGRWGQCGPHFYVMAKLLWDVDRDANQILDEYFAAMFGRSTGAAREAYDLLSSKLSESTDYLNQHPTKQLVDYLTPRTLTRVEDLLATANREADETRHRRNVQAVLVPVKYAPHYFAMRDHLSTYSETSDRAALQNAVSEYNAIRELVLRNEDLDAIPREAINRKGYFTLQRYFEPYLASINRSGASWTVTLD